MAGMETTQRSRAAAFGPEAQRYAARLPDWLPAVVCDPSAAVFGLEAAVRARMQGEAFFVAPLLEDNRAAVATFASGSILAQAKDPDTLRLHFDALAAGQLVIGGNAQSTIATVDTRVLDTLSDALFLSDALLVRSQTEYLQLRNRLRTMRAFMCVAPGVDEEVPLVKSGRRGGPIVVWAPNVDASRLGVIAYALDQLLADAVVICRSGMLANVRAQFVCGDYSALEQASVVIDASLSDPGTALGLARCSVPLVCSSTSGAHEFLNGVQLYDPWDWKSVLEAVSAAVCGGLPLPSRDPMPDAALRETLIAASPPATQRRPLVSIVIPTYNRPDLLDTCLANFDAQTYEQFELVVVNDAGERVDEVTAKYPRARLINREHNGGPIRACNTGVEAALGEYVLFCGDDDYFFPDALARFIAAFEGTGASMINSNGIIGFFKGSESGTERVAGYRWHTYMCLDRRRELGAGGITSAGVMFRRDLFLNHGLLDEENDAADYEIILRLMQDYEMPHIDSVSFLFAYRMDSKKCFSHAATLEASFETYRNLWSRYPSGGSAVIEQARSDALGWIARGQSGHYWEPAIYLPEPS